MDGGVLTQLVVALFGAAAVYGGIRADLRWLHERVNRLEERLDNRQGASHGNA